MLHLREGRFFFGLLCAIGHYHRAEAVQAITKAISTKDLFTTNAICTKNRCINPVFPGLEDLHQLSQSRWRCSALRDVQESMHFCRPLINYDPALLVTTAFGGNETQHAAVMKQDGAASTAFYYHLAGLGLEGWDYTEPWLSDNECVKAVWRLSCFTYFPRSQIGCYPGSDTLYSRPCKSGCHNYIKQCGVECCDESVQCVFTHDKVLPNGVGVHTEGYAPHDGPSSLCTGAARQHAKPNLGWVVMLLLLGLTAAGPQPMTSMRESTPAHVCRGAWVQRLVTCVLSGFFSGSLPRLWPRLQRSFPLVALTFSAFALQGCNLQDISNIDVPSHSVGNWRKETDYLLSYEFVPPGGSALDARLNSCSLEHLSQTLQCNGRGVCRMWISDGLVHGHPTSFCECDRDWADPECRTHRKSQAATFLLSLFFGFLGFDHFYLGLTSTGILKLFSLGGGGVWWLIDIIRIGSAPVHTDSFRVAADLPHWAFALITVSTACTSGFVCAYVSVLKYRARRRKDALCLQGEHEHLFHGDMAVGHGRKKDSSAFSAPDFSSAGHHYGGTAGAPYGGKVHKPVIHT